MELEILKCRRMQQTTRSTQKVETKMLLSNFSIKEIPWHVLINDVHPLPSTTVLHAWRLRYRAVLKNPSLSRQSTPQAA
jgi:hypothetical protein